MNLHPKGTKIRRPPKACLLLMINRFGSLLVNRNVVICYIGAKPPSRFFTPSRGLSGSLGVSRRLSGSLGGERGEFCTQQNSIIFGLLRKRCSYAGERPKMAPQVPQSAQLAYSLDNLMVFEPSRAPLEPSGCEPDHFKALKPDQNGRRGGQIALLDGKKTKSDGTKGHFTCI